jgi:hypothetical protein
LWILRDRGHADAIAIPMLADSEVVALAEAPDGRIAVGLANRGAVFLTIPPGWFQRPSLPPTLAPWESTRPHEALFEDRAVVLRSCRGKHGSGDEAARQALLAELRAAVHAPEARVRVALEETFDGDPDIAIRGADIEEILADVLPRVEKLGGKANLSVHKRFGSRGSASVEIKPCPGN